MAYIDHPFIIIISSIDNFFIINNNDKDVYVFTTIYYIIYI